MLLEEEEKHLYECGGLVFAAQSEKHDTIMESLPFREVEANAF